MSSKSAFHRVFTAFLLLAVLVFASLPAQARQARRPTTDRHSVAVTGYSTLSWIWHFVVGLWAHGTAKEGTSIDPNGNTNHAGTSTTAGDLTNEGTSIDPDGNK